MEVQDGDDLCGEGLVDGSEEPPSEDANRKTKKAFERKEKKAFALIAINLVDRQIAHTRHCKGPA